MQKKRTSFFIRIRLIFFMVLFITCFRLDTRCTYDWIGSSGKNCLNPHEGVLVKTTAEKLIVDNFALLSTLAQNSSSMKNGRTWGTWARKLAHMKTAQILGTWTRFLNARRFLSGKPNSVLNCQANVNPTKIELSRLTDHSKSSCQKRPVFEWYWDLNVRFLDPHCTHNSKEQT